MKCPVCNALIPPLAEDCVRCGATWKNGQRECPALFTVGDNIVQCGLGFRHNDRKHRTVGIRVADAEATLLWHYPTNNPDLMRSEDYKERFQR